MFIESPLFEHFTVTMDYAETLREYHEILVHDMHGDLIEEFKHSKYITDIEYERLRKTVSFFIKYSSKLA